MVLLGDLYLPDIDWSTNCSPQDFKCKSFLDLCCEYGFTQLVLEPTRLNNILDLVLCNDNMLISDIVVDAPFGLSDHNSIKFSAAIEIDRLENETDYNPQQSQD